MTTTSPTRLDGSVAPSGTGSGRVRVAAAALAASAATVAVLLATHPWGDRLDSGADTILNYDRLLEARDAAWPSMLLDSFAFAVIGLTVGLGVLHLARARGRIAALIGATLTTIGGILFAMGGTAFATLVWFITADGLADGAGQSLVDYANDHPGHLIGPNSAGFLLSTIGALVLAAALIRARTVPLAPVILYVVLVLIQFAGPARPHDGLPPDRDDDAPDRVRGSGLAPRLASTFLCRHRWGSAIPCRYVAVRRRSWWSLDSVVDLTFAVALAVLTVVNIFFPEPSMAYDYPPPNPLQLTLVLIASLVFALRRVAPTTTFFVMLVITGGITAAGRSAGMLPYGLFFAIYSLATYAPVRLAVAGLVAKYMHDVLLFALGVPYFEDAYVLLNVAWFTGCFSAGLLTREVRRARDRNQVRALEAERTKATATAHARVQERLRIARDMHDVVAHTLSVVSVQAGLARRLVPTRPHDAVEAMQRVERSAREATNDLRRLLGVLREDQPDDLSPAPGIRELESLAKDHGAHVTLSVSGNPDSLADSLKLTISGLSRSR